MIQRFDTSVLVVEDNDEDFKMLCWVLKKLSVDLAIQRCVDGDDALDFLHHLGRYTDKQRYPLPSLILLDLNLTMTEGQEVLATIKRDEALKAIPVIIWSTSDNPYDIQVSFQQGANSYILKPMSTDKLIEAIQVLNQYWFGVAQLPKISEE
jgi:CheY-like chemotaxis protein